LIEPAASSRESASLTLNAHSDRTSVANASSLSSSIRSYVADTRSPAATTAARYHSENDRTDSSATVGSVGDDVDEVASWGRASSSLEHELVVKLIARAATAAACFQPMDQAAGMTGLVTVE
jgi:hypothetical protein